MTEQTIESGGRGSGRTTRKIEQAIADMEAGKNVVFACITGRGADHAHEMAVQILQGVGYKDRITAFCTQHNKITMPSSRGSIEFVNYERAAQSLLGLKSSQVRADHAALEQIQMRLESAWQDGQEADRAIEAAQRALEIARAQKATASAKVSENRMYKDALRE